MTQNKGVLLSSCYFGPVQWYQKLFRYEVVYIERCESFIKQTFRNRCVIATTNGPQALSIPVSYPPTEQEGEAHPLIHMRISDHANWRHVHWNALQSAYGDSPFFDYYADDLLPFFEKRWENLFDFNMEITYKMCELLDIHPKILFTEHYQQEASSECSDFRYAIRPKHPMPDPDFMAKPYYQVYQQKWGFQPNLSILDLLFNMGNESILYL